MAFNIKRWFQGKFFNPHNWWVPVEKIPINMVATDYATAAGNTAVVVTYAAVPGNRHVIEGICVGYDSAPVGGSLTIADGATTIFKIPITAAGPAPIILPRPIRQAAVNTALTITLAAGGGTAVGYVNVLGKTLDGIAEPVIQT